MWWSFLARLPLLLVLAHGLAHTFSTGGSGSTAFANAARFLRPSWGLSTSVRTRRRGATSTPSTAPSPRPADVGEEAPEDDVAVGQEGAVQSLAGYDSAWRAWAGGGEGLSGAVAESSTSSGGAPLLRTPGEADGSTSTVLNTDVISDETNPAASTRTSRTGGAATTAPEDPDDTQSELSVGSAATGFRCPICLSSRVAGGVDDIGGAAAASRGGGVPSSEDGGGGAERTMVGRSSGGGQSTSDDTVQDEQVEPVALARRATDRVTLQPCGHAFHVDCVCRWVFPPGSGNAHWRRHNMNRDKKCPVCRALIAEEFVRDVLRVRHNLLVLAGDGDPGSTGSSAENEDRAEGDNLRARYGPRTVVPAAPWVEPWAAGTSPFYHHYRGRPAPAPPFNFIRQFPYFHQGREDPGGGFTPLVPQYQAVPAFPPGQVVYRPIHPHLHPYSPYYQIPPFSRPAPPSPVVPAVGVYSPELRWTRDLDDYQRMRIAQIRAEQLMGVDEETRRRFLLQEQHRYNLARLAAAELHQTPSHVLRNAILELRRAGLRGRRGRSPARRSSTPSTQHDPRVEGNPNPNRDRPALFNFINAVQSFLGLRDEDEDDGGPADGTWTAVVGEHVPSASALEQRNLRPSVTDEARAELMAHLAQPPTPPAFLQALWHRLATEGQPEMHEQNVWSNRPAARQLRTQLLQAIHAAGYEPARTVMQGDGRLLREVRHQAEMEEWRDYLLLGGGGAASGRVGGGNAQQDLSDPAARSSRPHDLSAAEEEVLFEFFVRRGRERTSVPTTSTTTPAGATPNPFDERLLSAAGREQDHFIIPLGAEERGNPTGNDRRSEVYRYADRPRRLFRELLRRWMRRGFYEDERAVFEHEDLEDVGEHMITAEVLVPSGNHNHNHNQREADAQHCPSIFCCIECAAPAVRGCLCYVLPATVFALMLVLFTPAAADRLAAAALDGMNNTTTDYRETSHSRDTTSRPRRLASVDWEDWLPNEDGEGAAPLFGSFLDRFPTNRDLLRPRQSSGLVPPAKTSAAAGGTRPLDCRGLSPWSWLTREEVERVVLELCNGRISSVVESSASSASDEEESEGALSSLTACLGSLSLDVAGASTPTSTTSSPLSGLRTKDPLLARRNRLAESRKEREEEEQEEEEVRLTFLRRCLHLQEQSASSSSESPPS